MPRFALRCRTMAHFPHLHFPLPSTGIRYYTGTFCACVHSHAHTHAHTNLHMKSHTNSHTNVHTNAHTNSHTNAHANAHANAFLLLPFYCKVELEIAGVSLSEGVVHHRTHEYTMPLATLRDSFLRISFQLGVPDSSLVTLPSSLLRTHQTDRASCIFCGSLSFCVSHCGLFPLPLRTPASHSRFSLPLLTSASLFRFSLPLPILLFHPPARGKMALKSINISGNFDWCPFEEHKNYIICFNAHNVLYSNSNKLNNYVYLLDINLNNDMRNLEIVSKMNFEEALKIEQNGENNHSSSENVKREKAKSGKAANGKAANGKAANGKAATGKAANGKVANEQAANEQATNEYVTNEYVTCLEWVNSNNFLENENDYGLKKGIIICGLTNGDIVLLNAQNMFNVETSYTDFILSKINIHESYINCLECNKHKKNLIATGGNDGQLFITDIENIYSPTSYYPYIDKNDLQKITSLNWNKKVSHILATSSNNGNTIIWDLKIKKSAVSFRDPHNRTKTSSLTWLSNQPTQILVSYDDDKNPCLQLWDLRNSNYPIKEIIGHSKGINNISFSDIDSNLLLSSGKDITKCWYINNNNFDIFNEVNNSANNIYSKWSPFIPDLFASSTNMDTIQVNSINNGNKMTTKYIPSFYKKDAGICFGFGGKICFFGNDTAVPSIATRSSVNSNPSTGDEGDPGVRGKNKFEVKCYVHPTEKELIAEADIFEKYIESGNYSEFCQSKISKSDDDHEKLTWKILQLLCTSQKADIVKHLGYNMDVILSKIMHSIGKQPGFIFKNVYGEKENAINYGNDTPLSNLYTTSDGVNYENGNITNNGYLDSKMNGITSNDGDVNLGNKLDISSNFNSSFDVDPEKFFRELGEKTENEQVKEGVSVKNGNEDTMKEEDRIAHGEGITEGEGGKKKKSSIIRSSSIGGGCDEGEVEGTMSRVTDERRTSFNSNIGNSCLWNSGVEAIIKECVLVGNIETAVELCLHQNRMADALLLSSFGGENLWHKTKNIYIAKQNDSFLRNVNYVLDDKLDVLVNTIDLSAWGEALSILCTYAISSPNFNSLCETLAKRLQNEKFDIRAASICYLCACNFAETVEIWSNMPSTKTSLLDVLQDLVEKMTVLKMVIKYDQYNQIMNQKINQYAELLANSGRLKAAMTFLCLIENDHTLESLILRDRIFNSATHILCGQVKQPISPFQLVHVKPFGLPNQGHPHQGLPHQGHPHQMYSQGCSPPTHQFKPSSPPLPGQSPMYGMKTASSSIVPPPHRAQQAPPSHMGYGQSSPPSPNKFNTQVIGGPPAHRSSFSAVNPASLGVAKPPPVPSISTPYIPPPNTIPSHTSPIGTSPPSYASVPNYSIYNANQNMKQEMDRQHASPSMYSTQSYTNVTSKALPNSSITPPVPLDQMIGQSNFSSAQNVAPPPLRNRNMSISSTSNLPQSSSTTTFQQDNNFFTKRECSEQQMYNPVHASSMPKNNFPGSNADSAGKTLFSPQSTGPPSSGKKMHAYV
ncbi:protein transport protein SEC31, putative (SEC31) [Plasmodium ovale wallikeri]|uniref:Protein transport protein SEC31, putative (SEC31) n=1 Tax=Plasmodium ovale wallikeri TaxID=864142 RepID=A0A1A8YJB0_PLAOA|nr:protein transport protein SEC31, putative (SEC31) [Plasmodium ovale wallikeri]